MRLLCAGFAIALLATPALADVRAGVAAWEKRDYARAIAEWRGPAEAGDADAQYNIGQAYRRGVGVPADERQAIAWYRRAADQGHPQAQASLALLLFQSPQRAEAFPWLEKAAAKGEARAQYVLATALFNGDGIAKDWPRAYALMRRASLGGLAPADESLRQMDVYLTPADKQKGDEILRAFAAAPPRAQGTTARAGTGVAATTRTASVTPARATATTEKAPAKSGPRVAEPAASKTVAPKPDGPAWRVQLGAFGKMDAARAHWKTLSSRPALAALKPAFVQRDGIVRVQAGPLANRAAAQRACAAATAAGSACFALQP